MTVSMVTPAPAGVLLMVMYPVCGAVEVSDVIGKNVFMVRIGTTAKVGAGVAVVVGKM
jgi:hypothetical protein